MSTWIIVLQLFLARTEQADEASATSSALRWRGIDVLLAKFDAQWQSERQNR